MKRDKEAEVEIRKGVKARVHQRKDQPQNLQKPKEANQKKEPRLKLNGNRLKNFLALNLLELIQ